MKILLVGPPALASLVRFEIAIYPPINLLSLIAYLEEKGYDIKLLDASILNLTPAQTVEKILSAEPDLVGFTFMTSQFGFVRETTKLIKEKNKNIIIVVGGVHSSILPKETLKEIPYVDYIVRHEGEITLEELIKLLDKNKKPLENELRKIKGIVFRNSKGEIIQNEPRELIPNLDILPIPAWHSVDVKKYSIMSSTNRRKKSEKAAVCISMSRGCPFQCVFCASGSVFGKTHRKFSVNWSFKQIKYLVDHGIKEFIFVDEIPTFNKEGLEELCNKIIENKLNITWACASRVNAPAINPKTLEIMKKAGCVRIDFGVEAGNNEVLRRIKKGITIEQVIEAHKLVHKAGMQTTTLMMVGHPYETMDDINDSLELIAKIETEFAEFSNATPFPGTELYKIAKENNWITTYDWDEYWIGNPLGIAGNGVFNNKEILQLTLYTNTISYLFCRINQLKGKMNLGGMMSIFFKDLITHNRFGYLPLFKKYRLLKSFMKIKKYPEEFSKLLRSYSIKDLYYPYFIKDPEKLYRLFILLMNLIKKNPFRLPTKRYKWEFEDILNLFKVAFGILIKIPTLIVYVIITPFMSMYLLHLYRKYYYRKE